MWWWVKRRVGADREIPFVKRVEESGREWKRVEEGKEGEKREEGEQSEKSEKIGEDVEDDGKDRRE